MKNRQERDRETATYLREKAAQCRGMSSFHQGTAAENLLAMARDFEAKADELDGDKRPREGQAKP